MSISAIDKLSMSGLEAIMDHTPPELLVDDPDIGFDTATIDALPDTAVVVARLPEVPDPEVSPEQVTLAVGAAFGNYRPGDGGRPRLVLIPAKVRSAPTWSVAVRSEDWPGGEPPGEYARKVLGSTSIGTAVAQSGWTDGLFSVRVGESNYIVCRLETWVAEYAARRRKQRFELACGGQTPST